MGKSLTAIYEDGVFKPLQPVELREHQQVVVTISDTEEIKPGKGKLPAMTLHELPQPGAELVTYWQNEGVFGSRTDITDSVAYAKALRREAETRTL